MVFHYDFRDIRSRNALIAAIGVHEQIFDAILNFKGPVDPSLPFSLSDAPAPDEVTTSVAVFCDPLFFRHNIPKKNKASGYRTVWEPTLCSSDYKALARRLSSFFRLVPAPFPHERAFGFRPGKNIRENAAEHKAK